MCLIKLPIIAPLHSFNNLLGGIQQLRGQNFTIFRPTPLCGQFLYPERGQKQTFFDPLPPHLVHVVIECPLITIMGQPLQQTL